MNKNSKIIFLTVIVFLILLVIFLTRVDNEEIQGNRINEEFINCLSEAGVVIYGSSTCPACARLEEEYGGYEIIKPIYIDCSGIKSEEEREKCLEEAKTGFVPEIQIKGEVLNEWGSPETLSEITGCSL